MSSFCDEELHLTFSNIRLANPKLPYPKQQSAKVKIEIVIKDKKVSQSAMKISNKDEIIWSEGISIHVFSQSTITFRIMQVPRIRPAKSVVEHTINMQTLLDMQEPSGMCNLNTLTFLIKNADVHIAFDKASQTAGKMPCLGDTWLTFVHYFKIVRMALDPLSKLFPYLLPVRYTLLDVPDLTTSLFLQDNTVLELIGDMAHIYRFMTTRQLSVLSMTQTQNMESLFFQTFHCISFIRDFAPLTDEFGNEMLQKPVVRKLMQEFKASFDEHLNVIEHSVRSEMTVVQYDPIQIIHECKSSRLLGDLPYFPDAGFQPEKCATVERSLLNEISNWVAGNMNQRVLLLVGQRGSSVAHTIFRAIQSQYQVVTMFCFSRNDSRNQRLRLFSTISRDVADHDTSWRETLLRSIVETAIRRSLDPKTQFETLIKGPSEAMSSNLNPATVVIIIGALDESVDELQQRRDKFLGLLFTRSSELPENIRFIITSKPEEDIMECHQYSDVSHCINLDN